MKQTLIRVFFRGIKRMINGSYKNPKNRIGDTIKLLTSNREYEVFKQSYLRALHSKNEFYFEIEFSFKKWVPKFFSPTIPFFIGMPGFISKLWLIDTKNGDFAGQYIFASQEDAEGYGNSAAQKLVKSLCITGSYSWKVVPV